MAVKSRKQNSIGAEICLNRLELLKSHQVSVYDKICRYLPLEVTNKRVKGWEHSRSLPDGSMLKMEAKETITPGDIFILIAAIKVFQDFRDTITETTLQGQEILEIRIKYRLFMTKYVKHRNDDKLLDSLKRLASFKVYWESISGRVTPNRYLYEFGIDENKQHLTLSISKKFAFYCDRHGWLLNFTKLQQINSPSARALFLYLSINSGKIFKQDTLEKCLDMSRGTSTQSRDNRKQIKRALLELINVGVVEEFWFDGDRVNIVQSRHKSATPATKTDHCRHKRKPAMSHE